MERPDLTVGPFCIQGRTVADIVQGTTRGQLEKRLDRDKFAI